MLEPTEIRGRIVFLGVVRDRRETLRSEPREAVEVDWTGFAGECHGGLTRPSCSRVLKQYPERGTEIRNTRQVTVLSAEELAGIADALGLDRLDPAWLGANLVFEGIPALTTLPPASRLVFEGGVTLTVDVENGPCRFPADEIEAEHPGHGRAFPKAARGRRGLVAWVEKPGRLSMGEVARLHVPPQRVYAPLSAGVPA